MDESAWTDATDALAQEDLICPCCGKPRGEVRYRIKQHKSTKILVCNNCGWEQTAASTTSH